MAGRGGLDVTDREAETIADLVRGKLPLAAGVAAGVVLALIAALAAGWNSPRPGRPPDWEAPALSRRLTVASNDTALALLGHRSTDFTFEVIAVPVTAPDSGFYGYGLAYRAQDPTHYCAFAVGGDGYYAVLRIEGSEEHPLVEWQQFPHIRRGRQSNRLRVTCARSSCDFSINDEYAATVEESKWLSGDVGLWARGFDEGALMQFSSARLWTADD
ncbi:MAG: hypothetical protein PVF54_09145 [Anaerolineae bacterium]|jgi:hypothetical protein